MKKILKMSIAGMICSLFIFGAIGVSATFDEGEPGGLTPGFWKNIRKHGIYWEIYDPEDMIGDIFELPVELDSLDVSLLDALKFGGGDDVIGMARILLRAAVAALLNDANGEIEYPYEGDIIGDVNSALASLDRDTMEDLKDMFDEANNLGFEF